jgi:hypothetical protein
MIDFSTLKGLEIPEGVVTQIADASGRVIWVLDSGGKVILQVEKITSDTYVGETKYTGEEFILLDIYPKTNGTVSVTYGSLTKTITDTSGAAEPNAQQVFFGTFNGVSDSVATPVSGELVIEGGCSGFACGTYKTGSKATNIGHITCITAVTEWGSITRIPPYALSDGISGLQGASKAAISALPEGILSIGKKAFYSCPNVTVGDFPEGLLSIGSDAFYGCTKQQSVNLPSSVSSIGDNPWIRNDEVGKPQSNFITVDKNNQHYRIDGNCLIEINTGRLVAGYGDGVIPSYIVSIGSNAFRGNRGITSVAIPKEVISIGDAAFMNCRSLTNISVLTETPPTLGMQVFDQTGDCPIIVPKGYRAAYQFAEGWSSYSDRIMEAS